MSVSLGCVAGRGPYHPGARTGVKRGGLIRHRLGGWPGAAGRPGKKAAGNRQA
ncbi:hypothetical protein [Planotetraspora sp. GP83]|uniref:hypothetical protein n=1 Tax=Planotetraspora sp. GP83 TaxID=3156264 RepID=UPI0035199603